MQNIRYNKAARSASLVFEAAYSLDSKTENHGNFLATIQQMA